MPKKGPRRQPSNENGFDDLIRKKIEEERRRLEKETKCSSRKKEIQCHCPNGQETLHLAKTISAKLKIDQNLLDENTKRKQLRLNGCRLNGTEWEKRFLSPVNEKEKEHEGQGAHDLKRAILEIFEFIEKASKGIAYERHVFYAGGNRIDAMKMCVVKLGQCLKLLSSPLFPIIVKAGNAISHDIEEIIPHCMGMIFLRISFSDWRAISSAIKRLLNKTLFS